jgi:arylsulfatase A
MNRRQFLAAGAAALSATAAQRRLPNIVLIMADDLGYECLSCNGSVSYKTPNLDRLAATGVRFSNAHSTPLCTPTRVQLMTGKYNFRNYTEFGSLPGGEFTFAHLLKKAGYVTGVTGKWQLAGAIEGTAYKGKGSLPSEAGFDEHCLWQVKDRGSRYWTPTLQVNEKLQSEQQGGYGPDLFGRFAVDFIERHRSRPFFLYYPMVLTHDPFVPTPESASHTNEEKDRNDTRWFGDMVSYMDQVVGRIVSRIDELKLSNDTLILFTGDNGTHPTITTMTKDGPYRGDKGNTTMAGTHVPMIARWTGTTPSGVVCDDLIDFTDFFPTLAELAPAKMPEDHPKDGRSFAACLTGKKRHPREWIFCHYEPKWGKFKPARWVMNKRWKLYEDGRFYDIAADPRELSPIATRTPEMERTADRFRQVFERMKRN